MAREKQAAKKDIPLDMNPERVDQWKATEKDAEYFMTPEEIDDLLRTGKVLYITHTLKDGWPLVTPMFYCVLGKDVYTTTVKGRRKEIAYTVTTACPPRSLAKI